MKRHCVVPFLLLAGLPAVSCKHTPPANVAAEVNNHAITYTELEKAYQSQYPQQPDGISQDLVMSQKLDLLGNLITKEIMLQRAEKSGLTATDADVDTELNKMKAPFTKEEFERQLNGRHMTLDDLRAQIRQQLTVEKLTNKEITSHVTITDADVTSFYNANKKGFNFAEPQVHMAQILVTPFPDAEASAKIKDLEARLKRGEDFAMLAQNYSEDPNTAPNGGDMGFIPESNLEKASPELRRMVMSLSSNAVSPIIHTQDGYRILRMISKEPAGQRDLNDPRVQQSIRETLLNGKDQLLKSAYFETARNNSTIRNYLAASVVENAGKK
jgi:peptidyl-prolyl cis-trans isomerase SurA